jgi:uncharacterized protein YjgD (DUF1641 family)
MEKTTKDELIKKWEDSGILDGLTKMDENSKIVKLFEPNLTQKIFEKTIPNDDKKIELTTDELLNLLKEAYRNGYSTYEMVDAGLEHYDADGYARWVLFGLKQ